MDNNLFRIEKNNMGWVIFFIICACLGGEDGVAFFFRIGIIALLFSRLGRWALVLLLFL